jgi:hypothetical protein
VIYRFSRFGGRRLDTVNGPQYIKRMTDGQLVRFENGGIAEVKRLVVKGGYQTVLVAVELPGSRPASSPPKQ